MVVKTIPLLLPPPLVGTQPAPPGGESLWPLSENWLKIKWILVKTPKKFRHLRPTLVIRGGGKNGAKNQSATQKNQSVTPEGVGHTLSNGWWGPFWFISVPAPARTPPSSVSMSPLQSLARILGVGAVEVHLRAVCQAVVVRVLIVRVAAVDVDLHAVREPVVVTVRIGGVYARPLRDGDLRFKKRFSFW